MEISGQVHSVLSAEMESRDGSYIIEIPHRELRLGSLEEGEAYRVAVLSLGDMNPLSEGEEEHGIEQPTPPVAEGDTRTVKIEAIGEQGDGIARVVYGFVVIVPETEQGEQVTIQITDVKKNVAFASVVKRLRGHDENSPG